MWGIYASITRNNPGNPSSDNLRNNRRAPATGAFIALVAAAIGTWSSPAPAQESIPQAVHRIDGTVRELGRQSREMDRKVQELAGQSHEMDRKSREMDRKLQELDRKLREVDRTARDLSRRLGELESAGSGGSGQASSGEAVEAGLGLTREDRNVSWEDARQYVQWLSRKTGKRYRLLSESEWEYVARAGTKTPFHYGPTVSTAQANYDGNYTYGSGRKGRDRQQTMSVGSFPANAFGLHDVHGNVKEWVTDCRHTSYRGAPWDGSAWVRGGDCRHRMLRSGSWYSVPAALRSAGRFSLAGSHRGSDAGFRVARTLD